MEEALLKIHRELTDKEKLSWALKDLAKLRSDYDMLLSERNNLKTENGKLAAKIKWDEIQYGKLNGQDHVSVKAYLKLRERYKHMEKTFWENWNELNELKKDAQSDKM